MLDRISREPEPPVAAAGKMSRRKQACPSRSIKASSDLPASSVPDEEGPSALSLDVSGPESTQNILLGHSNPDDPSTPDTRDDSEGLDITPPLVINTDEAPSSPPPPHPSPSSIDVTPPLTEDTPSPEEEDHTLPPSSSSPGLDIPPESSEGVLPPLSLNLLPSSSSPPASPDNPSTPSSLNSSSSQAEAANAKNKRGKKIMPVQGDNGLAHYQCPICQERLPGNHEFTAHIRSHNAEQGGKPNTCIICHKELSSQSSLDRHMLVHSGERPFKCKVCGMSFTTNGNMHRHTRIHSKEDVKAATKQLEAAAAAAAATATTKPSSKSKPSSSSAVPLAPKPPASLPSPSSLVPAGIVSWHRPSIYNPDRSAALKSASGVDLQKFLTSESMAAGLSQPSTPIPLLLSSPLMHGVLSRLMLDRKRSLPPSMVEEDVSPSKRAKEEEEGAGSRLQLLGSGYGGDVRENGLDMSTDGGRGGERGPAVSAFRVVKSSSKKPTLPKSKSHRKPDPYQRGPEGFQHHHQPLLNILGHGGHLHHHTTGAAAASNSPAPLREKTQLLDHERAAVSSNAAPLGRPAPFVCSESDCEQEFDSQEKLEFHRLLDHCTNEQAELFVEETLAAKGVTVESKDMVEEKEGFQDLDFMDFTAKKFPLAAKAGCERVKHKTSSRFHSFRCQECGCCFPNKSSLTLHLASHVPHNVTQCSRCQCHFITPDQICVHMLSHAARDTFDATRKKDFSEEDQQPQLMDKENYLAMYGLISKEELSGCDKNEAVIETLTKEQNNKYFAKMSKVFGGNAKKTKEENTDRISKRDTGTLRESLSSIPSMLNDKTPAIVPSSDTTRVSASAPPQFSSPDQPSGVIQSIVSKEGSLTPSRLSQALSAVPSALQPVSSAMNGDVERDQQAAQNVFQCSYCGEAFPTKRALKAHTRTHFGSPKYQCTICTYSSSDKSTLTRHMRTHNGQRPFECGLCDFGFTTKANCERHIRKRHGFVEKEDVERCLVFRESSEEDCKDGTSGALQAPSTLCQYCGEDLKFFPALQIHMKTRCNTTDLKVFVCAVCSARLPSKTRAVRHLQKHHTEVLQRGKDADTLIHTTALPPAAIPSSYTDIYSLDDDSDGDMGFDTASPSPSSTPGMDHSPPAAHSTPVLASAGGSGGRGTVQALEAPLNFSLKNSDMAARVMQHYGVGGGVVMVEGGDDEEEPMDLSTKGRRMTMLMTPAASSSSAVSLSPSPAATPVKMKGNQSKASLKLKDGSLMGGDVFSCSQCNKTFPSPEAAQLHLLTIHQVSPPSSSSPSSSAFATLFPRPPSSDNNNNTTTSGGAQIPATLLPLSLIPGLQQLSPSSLLNVRAAAAGGIPAGIPLVPTHPAFSKIASLFAQRAMNPLLASSIGAAAAAGATTTATAATSATTAAAATPKESVTSPLPGSAAGTTVNSAGSESSCDLASVNKIIESTSSQSLQVFLKPQVMNSGSDDSEPQSTPWESAEDEEEDSDQSLDKLYRQSLNGTFIKVELPEEAGTPPQPSQLIRHFGSDGNNEVKEEEEEEAEDYEGQEENKDDSNLSQQSPKAKTSPGATKKTGDPSSVPVKKKRNSYADSPHKMKCPHCPRSFPWISSLNRHMLTHTGQKPFKCTRCNVTFSTKSNRERHLIRKHGVNMLDPASRQTMDRPYKCHLCVFSSFSTEGNLLKHYKERHPGTTVPERYLMRGPEDDDFMVVDMEEDGGLSNMDGWSENGSVDNDDLEAPIPAVTKAGVKTSLVDIVTNLIKNETSKPSPSPSKPATPTTVDLTQNSVLDDNNEDDSVNNDPPSNNETVLTSTPLNGSAERHVNPERDNYNVDKITFCWKCGEQFTSRKLLVRHLKEHNIDLPFKCYLCDASFDSRCECLMHQEKSHPNDWAVLKDKNSVDSIAEYAKRLDQIVERNCKTGQFGEEGEEGGDRPAPSTTPTTTATTTTPATPNTAATAAAAGEDAMSELVASDYLQRKVYCSLCSKRFWSLQDLRRHMRSHTGERPFECDMCFKRFTLKHSMMRHRRKHIGNANGGSPTAFSEDEEDAQLSESSGKAPATHMGSGHKALRQHLAATASLKSTPNIPTTVMESNNNVLPSDDKNVNDDDKETVGKDILHTILGVESETIDQIIDAKDSAASLLGV